MNYRHVFHAGNFADVHKHVVLTRILDYLRQKPAPFRVIDSHAGAGLYDLTGPEAEHSGEWRVGAGPVFDALRTGALTAAAKTLLQPYFDILSTLNPSGQLHNYPGSPLIAAALLRSGDRLIACEPMPQAAASLKASLRGDARAKVLTIDGWMALNANVPPKERRGLVLVDPPYEETADFTRLPAALADAHQKWPTGIYLMWYPIKARAAPDALARRLRKLGVPKLLRCEITLGLPRGDVGLVGSGLIVVNPPYTLEQELRIVLPALARLFSPDASSMVDWLAPKS
jgi:23S rRNA (adenine2030-N6)-methyltransferase